MDHNFQDYQAQDFAAQGDFSQPPPKKNAAYYRAMAREKLRPCYWYAFAASLLASLLGGISSGEISVNTSGVNVDVGGGSFPIRDLAEAWQARDFSMLFEGSPAIPVLLILGLVGGIFGIAFSLFVGAPMHLGYQKYQLNVMDGNGKDLSVLFRYFKTTYAKSIGLHLIYSLLNILIALPLYAVMLFGVLPAAFELALVEGTPENGVIVTVVLWTLLMFAVAVATIAASVWISYRYAFCYTILAEYPEMSPLDALRSSATLMKGKKWRLFCLDFSFFGLSLLAVCCTCGIGIFFLSPYMSAAKVAFYHDVTNRDAAKEVEFPSIDPDDYIAE